jgi:hypothetical protein
MDIVIESKMTNGSHHIFENLDSLSKWLEKMRLELDENGWNDHNEFTQRIVAYLVDDKPDEPSCELLVYSPIVGQAKQFIVDDENSF